MLPWVRQVQLESLDSSGCAQWVVGIFRDRCVHWGALWWSSGSSGFAGFIGFRPGCRRVHPGSLGLLWFTQGVVWLILGGWVHCGAPLWSRIHPVLRGSLWCALVVVAFILGLWVHWGVHWGVVGFIWGNWVHWGAPWGSSDSSGLSGFIGVRPEVDGFMRGR